MIIIAIRTLLFQLCFIFVMLKLRFVYVPRLILPILPALIRNVSLSSASSFVANESHLYCSGSGFFWDFPPADSEYYFSPTSSHVTPGVFALVFSL